MLLRTYNMAEIGDDTVLLEHSDAAEEKAVSFLVFTVSGQKQFIVEFRDTLVAKAGFLVNDVN